MNTSTQETFIQNDGLNLGYTPMDEVHQEFVLLVQVLLGVPDEQIAVRLEQLYEHTQAHFAMENTWMKETNFPPRDCHVEEHDAVLKSFMEVTEKVAQGNFEIARALGRQLLEWFPQHADYMDAALAHWMVKQRFGAKPLVFHKKTNT